MLQHQVKTIFLASAFIVLLTGCKKNYQCDCNTYDSLGNYVSTTSNTYKEYKRSTATEACERKSQFTTKCVIVN